MSESTTTAASTALRRAFDESFARPLNADTADLVPVLAVRVGGDPYVIRVLELTGIVRAKTIVPLPSAAPAVLGLAGVRGSVVPVYSLDLVLGYGAGSGAQPDWLALCDPQEPIGFAFHESEGCLRVDRSAIHAVDAGQPVRAHVPELVRTGAVIRGVISIPSLVASIRRRAGQDGRQRES